MKKYGRLSGDAGVVAYALKKDAIDVKFVDGRVYRYSHASAGAEHIARMKVLAEEGKGLTTYISQHVRERYE